MVTVNFYASARAAFGAPTAQFEVKTVGALVEALGNQSSRLAQLLPTCSYLLNSESCNSSAELKSGDSVDVLPQFAGG